MKQTTFDIIDQAMGFNVEIQDDNLNLQASKGNLLRMSREMDRIATILNSVTDKNAKEYGTVLQIQGLEAYSDEDSKVQLQNKLKEQYKSLETDISRKMLYMYNCGLADLNRKFNFTHFTDTVDKSAIMFNYYTVENLSTSFTNMLQSLSELGNSDLSYEDLREKFMNDNELDLLFTGTEISDEDYVTINPPQPRYQSTKDAELDKEHLNGMGKLLNSIATDDVMQKLAHAKYNYSARLLENRNDAIKSSHFISQMLMAIKNATLLLKNYNVATLNELQ